MDAKITNREGLSFDEWCAQAEIDVEKAVTRRFLRVAWDSCEDPTEFGALKTPLKPLPPPACDPSAIPTLGTWIKRAKTREQMIDLVYSLATVFTREQLLTALRRHAEFHPLSEFKSEGEADYGNADRDHDRPE